VLLRGVSTPELLVATPTPAERTSMNKNVLARPGTVHLSLSLDPRGSMIVTSSKFSGDEDDPELSINGDTRYCGDMGTQYFEDGGP
jgi:hypothetical protein